MISKKTLLTSVMLAGASAAAVLAGNFGVRPVYPDAKLSDVISRVSEYDGQRVRLSGKIEDVCQKKGCWMMVSDGKRSMRVKFKDYSFFVPRKTAGKSVTLEGVVKAQTLSEEEARHYASESPSGKPNEIKGPQKTVSMLADGVWIEGAEPPGGQAPMSQPESGSPREAGSGSSR